MKRALLLWCLATPLVASGQENGVTAAPDPTAHRHLGFYLHLDIGVGYLGTSASQGGPSLSGAAVPLSIVIGGAVAEDWIIAGDLWAAAGPSPVGSTWGATAVAGVGLNVTHYFMPAKGVRFAQPVLHCADGRQRHGLRRTNEDRIWGQARGGEGVVGRHPLGTGRRRGGLFASNHDNGSGTSKWTTAGGGFLFSATYN